MKSSNSIGPASTRIATLSLSTLVTQAQRVLRFTARVGFLGLAMIACAMTAASATAYSYITLDAPLSLFGLPAGDTFDDVRTELYGINDQGQIIGQITAFDETSPALPRLGADFLYSNGTFTQIDVGQL